MRMRSYLQDALDPLSTFIMNLSADSEGSGETVHVHSLAWAFASRIGDKYNLIRDG